MHAMVLKKPRTALAWTELPDRHPGPGEIRVHVAACGVCRTDLRVVDGELPDPRVPIIPGHEIVGRIDELGPGTAGLTLGARVGIPWLGHACGVCPYCVAHRENLCDRPLFTGYTRDGGFAAAVIADARFAFPLGEVGADVALAPLLCAGLIGWRSLVIAGAGKKIGLYGFGAAAHLLAQVAKWQGRSVFAFTRPGDAATQAFARGLGATWAGGSDAMPPEPLMRQRRNLQGNEDSNFPLFDTRQIADALGSTTQLMTTLLAAVAGVSLLVGGIGIMNIMLVSVTERTREIGIRLAIGALGGEVLLQFLVEAVTLSCIGGLLGILLALGLCAGLARLIHVPFSFNPQINVIAFLFSAAVGIVFGYAPARRAARLNPIDALRHE
jgi:threonine dehydrogenase-like Zn-dependent dehydrogenase